jgi:hypothetical protein
MQAGAMACELIDAMGAKNPINRQRMRKLIYSTNVVPKRLIEDGYPFAYDLRSAIGDWLASDESVRPPGCRARPVPVPLLEVAQTEVLAPVRRTPAQRG